MNTVENYPTPADPCIYCGQSTAFGSGNFVNRIGGSWTNEAGEDVEGWVCAMCGGYECDECGKPIAVDCETRVDYEDEDGHHYGNYHEECYDSMKHGFCETYCDNCGDLTNANIVYTNSPWNFASGHAGESAIFCKSCESGFKQGKNWEELSGGALQELSDD